MKKRPKAPQFLEEPPAGLWYEKSRAAEKPFRARWRQPGGAKVSRGFESAEDRARFAGEWLKQREQLGRAAQIVTPDMVATWQEFSRLTGGTPPLEVARWWAKVHGSLGGGLPLDEAVRRYLSVREVAPGQRDTMNHLRLHLRRLSEHFGAKPIGEITSEHVRTWLQGLRSKRLGGAPVGEGSRRHHYLSANLLFEHAVRESWLERSPMRAVEAPTWGPVAEVGILTVDQARELFWVNRYQPVIARMALEAFGGLRASSAGRLLGEHVVWHSQGVDLPASLHKSSRRHFVDGQPANLWRWLGAFAFTPATWALSPRMYALEKSLAFSRAKITAPHNALRHSFATYHLAAFKDPGRTAVLMQHRRSPEILWRHYVGRATEAEGRAFFEIVPDGVG